MRPRLIVSCGDINGIGMECFFGALGNMDIGAAISIAIHPGMLDEAIARYDLDGSILTRHAVQILPVEATCAIRPGVECEHAGKVAVASLSTGINHVLAGYADALVTLPVSKRANTLAGWEYPGQTEMLGAMAGGQPLMILCTDTVRVALATVHEPIARVAGMLTVERVVAKAMALHTSLQRDFGIAEPHIGVLGLNPHAGEAGLIGKEELDVIIPAIGALHGRGINASGPHPADGYFAFGEYRNADGILAMYHDQGLIPLKLLAQGGGVNVTANLGIVRTSPDHGTAFAIAGKRKANPASVADALRMAVDIVQNRKA